jgi:hypothetical protein
MLEYLCEQDQSDRRWRIIKTTKEQRLGRMEEELISIDILLSSLFSF